MSQGTYNRHLFLFFPYFMLTQNASFAVFNNRRMYYYFASKQILYYINYEASIQCAIVSLPAKRHFKYPYHLKKTLSNLDLLWIRACE